jgi:hypothetical protein
LTVPEICKQPHFSVGDGIFSKASYFVILV